MLYENTNGTVFDRQACVLCKMIVFFSNDTYLAKPSSAICPLTMTNVTNRDLDEMSDASVIILSDSW